MGANAHGLDRAIPAHVKRQVRQECGFGCVICGRLPYEYDHFDPEFTDAKEHRAEGIALLCSRHHSDRTAGRIAQDTVRAKRITPCNTVNDPKWDFNLGTDPLTFIFGGNRQEQGDRAGISINGIPVFRLEREEGEWLITGNLCDDLGRATLRFQRGELIASRGQWDVTLEGHVFAVRRASGNVVAELAINADQRVVELRRLSMRLANGYHLEGDSDKLVFSGPKLNLTVGGNTTTGVSGDLVSFDFPALGTWDDWIAPPVTSSARDDKADAARRRRRKAAKAARKRNR